MYLYSSRLGELTKAKLRKNCQCIVAITALHNNNNVVKMKKALLDNKDILDGIALRKKKCSDSSLLVERCNNIVILPAVGHSRQ